MKHARIIVAFVASTLCLISLMVALITTQSPTSATNQTGCQNFPETGYQVCGRFLEYWRANGGLAQQGYPISIIFDERNADPPAGDGKVHRVQYFQRARFEEHLENTAPYDVLLGLVGAEQYKGRYPNGPTNPLYTPPATTVATSFVNIITVQGGPPGGTAYVLAKTNAGVTCSITYLTPAGTISQAQGLENKAADGNGEVAWSWKIGTNTRPGTGSVDVSCGGATATAGITIS
jgi:hypothetical protein